MNNQNRAAAIGVIFLIAGIILAGFFPLLTNHSFVWDDELNILQNAGAASPDCKGIARFWTGPYLNMYIPVVYSAWSGVSLASHALGLHEAGSPLNAGLFHFVNLVLHLLNGLLVFWLLEKLVKNRAGAVMGALFFALHPVQAETAAYITELKTLLAFAFSMGAVNLYYSHKLSPEKNGRLPVSASIGVFLLFALSLLSKPTAVATPVFLFIINLLILDWGVKKSLRETIPWFLIIIPFAIIAKSVQPPYSHQFVSTMGQRLLIYGDAVAHYMLKAVYPASLGIDYGRTPQYVLNSDWGYFAWIVPAAVAGSLLLAGKRARPYLAGIFIFIAGFGPVSGLAPFVFQTISTVADRYMYFSMTGVALTAAFFIARHPNIITKCLAGAVLLMLGIGVNLQVRTWDGNEKLYAHAIRTNPQSAISYNNFASRYLHGTPRGVMFYHRALTLKPGYAMAARNLCSSILILKNEQPDLDLNFLVRPENRFKAQTGFYRAAALNRVGEWAESRRWMGEALALDVFNPIFLNNYGILCWRLKDYKTARTLFKLAGVLSPDNNDITKNIRLTLPEAGPDDTTAAKLNFFYQP